MNWKRWKNQWFRSQIVGREELWNRIFDSFGVSFDLNLFRSLAEKDSNTKEKTSITSLKKYKVFRSRNWYLKYVEAHADQLEENKSGIKYKIWVAVKVAKKTIKSAPERNHEGTLLADWRWTYFHPKYCVVRGHKSCTSGVATWMVNRNRQRVPLWSR